MALSEFELPTDRLSTADSDGKRIFLHPADVSGFFRKHRTRVQFVLIIFFLVLPWVRIGGRQALLLNLAERHFEIFGLSLRAHNAPLLFFVFAVGAFGLFFATAVFGRIWCGWACPQTVFIDGVFRRIERWIEGPALERRKLEKQPWDFSGAGFAKLFKRTSKWVLYSSVSLVLTHSFLAYFVGTEKLSEMIQSSPRENWGSFLFMLISTAVILFDFAWFREQFCTIVCPYGRFQSALMDSTSMIVAYDVARGEPRATPQAKVLAKAHSSKLGDCVNCYRCVQVCPTGIDIRRGLQMECIACTSCIDACDDVMTKLKRPTGLIRYDNASMTRKTSSRKRQFGFRGGLYLALCLLSVAALGTALAFVKPVDIQVLRAKDTPYTVQTLDTGTVMVVNHLKIEISNQSGAPRQLDFSAVDLEGAHEIQLITATRPYLIEDNQVAQVDVFLRLPKSELVNGQKKIRIQVRDHKTADESSPARDTVNVEREVTLVGPFS